jgi:succinate dehydrogenase/fumarate reductase flavoprotein subunit
VKDLSQRWTAPLERTEGENPFKLREEMEELMWKKVGVVRNGADLESAVPAIGALRRRAENMSGTGGTIFNAKWNEAVNTVNLLTVADMIARSALMRTESRGAHYRQDHPTSSPDWFKNIRLRPEGADMKFWTTDVKFTRLTPPDLQPAKQAVGV